jgi:hypothetical protein
MVEGPASRPALDAGVDDLQLSYRSADLESLVVDRERDQAGFQAPSPDGVGELDGVLADHAHGHLRVATHEVLDEPRKQEMVGGAERPQRRGSAGQRARSAHDVRGLGGGRDRALGFRPQQPPRVGELQPAFRPEGVRSASTGSRSLCRRRIGGACLACFSELRGDDELCRSVEAGERRNGLL